MEIPWEVYRDRLLAIQREKGLSNREMQNETGVPSWSLGAMSRGKGVHGKSRELVKRYLANDDGIDDWVARTYCDGSIDHKWEECNKHEVACICLQCISKHPCACHTGE